MDDESDDKLPSGKQVARRALVLAGLAARAYAEARPVNPETECFRQDVLTWLEEHGLRGEMDEWEHSLLQTEQGGLEKNQYNKASWSSEGLCILAWALNRAEFPPHDTQNDPIAAAKSIGFLNDGGTNLIERPDLRTIGELKAAREVLYAVHCRLCDFKRSGPRSDFGTWVEEDDVKLLGIDLELIVVEGDLAIGGKPLGSVTPDELQTSEWIVCEQHRAAIWLVGEYPEYWNFSVDT